MNKNNTDIMPSDPAFNPPPAQPVATSRWRHIEEIRARRGLGLFPSKSPLIDIMDGTPSDPAVEKDSAQGTAIRFLPWLPHKAQLHTRHPAPFCEDSYPVHLRVEHFENPGSLPWRVERTRWHPGLLTASAQEYREYVASCVELEMQTSIYGYWSGARLKILSNAVSLCRALVAEVQLYRHQLTHGLNPECSHLRVIDKSLWLSRLVKWLLKIPSNPYPWVDDIIQARDSGEGGISLSADAGPVSGKNG